MGTMGVTNLPVSFSEPDFMIKGIYKFSLFGQELWIGSTTVSLLIVSALLIIFALFARHALVNAKDIPDTFQNIIELLVEALQGMCDSILGENTARFFNYIGTIFLFILLSNFSGLLGLRNPTADYGVTFLLGIVTFIIVQYQGFKNSGAFYKI